MHSCRSGRSDRRPVLVMRPRRRALPPVHPDRREASARTTHAARRAEIMMARFQKAARTSRLRLSRSARRRRARTTSTSSGHSRAREASCRRRCARGSAETHCARRRRPPRTQAVMAERAPVTVSPRLRALGRVARSSRRGRRTRATPRRAGPRLLHRRVEFESEARAQAALGGGGRYAGWSRRGRAPDSGVGWAAGGGRRIWPAEKRCHRSADVSRRADSPRRLHARAAPRQAGLARRGAGGGAEGQTEAGETTRRRAVVIWETRST